MINYLISIQSCPASLEHFIGPLDSVIHVGETAILRCLVEKANNIYWKRNGQMLDTEKDPRFKVNV